MSIRLNKKQIFTNKKIKEATILNIADVHYRNDKYSKRLADLKELIESIKPTLICMPGDFLDTLDAIIDDKDILLEFLYKISKLCPTVLSFGTHDYYTSLNVRISGWFNDLASVSDTFYPIFPGQSKTVAINDDISAVGYSLPIDMSYEFENKESLLPYIIKHAENFNLNQEQYNLFLCHSAISFFGDLSENGISMLKAKYIDLIASGHNHAGMMPKMFEFLNFGLISPSKKLFPQNSSGLFSKGNGIYIDISRGFLKIPGTVKEELKSLGETLYGANDFYKPDVSVLTITPK